VRYWSKTIDFNQPTNLCLAPLFGMTPFKLFGITKPESLWYYATWFAWCYV